MTRPEVGPAQVDLERQVEVLLRRLEEVDLRPQRGAVREQRRRPERAGRLVAGALDRGHVALVGGDHDRAPPAGAHVLGRAFALGARAVHVDDDVAPRVGQLERDGPAEAFGGAGDEGGWGIVGDHGVDARGVSWPRSSSRDCPFLIRFH